MNEIPVLSFTDRQSLRLSDYVVGQTVCAEGRAPGSGKNAFSGCPMRGSGWRSGRDVSLPAQDPALAFYDRLSSDPCGTDCGGCLFYGITERIAFLAEAAAYKSVYNTPNFTKRRSDRL